MTKKQYRPWNPEQDYLFPPRVRDWLPAEHLAFFVGDVIESLDIAPIERAIQGKDPRGEQPYHPRMMLAVWVYGYAVGIVSSRGLERAIRKTSRFEFLLATVVRTSRASMSFDECTVSTSAHCSYRCCCCARKRD